MSEHSQKTPFIKASSQDQYGKIPLKSWVGKVVAYESQKEQIDEGWGWRYKVRILGDDSNSQNVADEELSYAICLLPTTAGSGAAYKLRSVRVSQGDMVYGIYGGDGPRIIIGVFPRTQETTTSSGAFGTLSGFYGSLNKNDTLDGEFNEQTGPKTPNTDPVGPKNYNKAEQREPSDKSKDLGVIAGGDENVDVNKKLTPKKMLLSLKDYAKNLFKGEDAVNSKENLDKIIEDFNKDKSRTNTEREVVNKAIDTSVKQNLIEDEEAKKKKKEIKELKVVNVNDQGIILNSEAVRDGLLTYVDGNGKQFVKFTSPSGEVTFKPADEIRKSAAKTAAYFEKIENEDTTYVDSSSSSESTETFTTSSSSDVTYDETTNTFTSTSEITTTQTMSGLVVGGEAPKTVTDIKLRLVKNEFRVKYMLKLYEKVNNKEKVEIARRHLKELKTIDPTTYDGSSLQAELKSSYTGIVY